MTYKQAKTLSVGDTVITKLTGRELHVKEIEHDPHSNDIFLRFDETNVCYHHTAVNLKKN